jgi:WD40 repeat protein
MAAQNTESLKRLESLFIEKLTEKYKLTERDIKRAFCKFDKDNSGYLDLDELTTAVSGFLNGVDRRQVAELVQCYDIDGDGSISLAEFSRFLLSRNSPNKEDWISVDQLTTPSSAGAGAGRSGGSRGSRQGQGQPQGRQQGGKATAARSYGGDFYEESTDLGGELTNERLAYLSKVYLQNLRSALTKIVSDNRNSNKIPLANRLERTTTQLYEAEACHLILDAFAPYLRRAEGGGGADYSSFCRVLRKYAYPGGRPPEEEVLEYVYLMCCLDPGEPDRGANPQYLLDALFEKPKTQVNKFGFVKEAAAGALDTGRPTVGKGPLKPVEQADLRGRLEISDIPYRFVTRKCRTSLAAPSDFDMSMVDRSARLPNYDMTRQYVFGMNSNLYSGDMLYSIPAEGPAGNSTMLYTSAAVGVMHDSVSNTQCFFDGHTDDITCISLEPFSGLVATGQTGKRPFVCVWDYNYCTTGGEFCGDHNYEVADSSGLVVKIGEGFFQRGVCAVCFSYDAAYVCAIGCDDSHTMGLWDIATLSLVFSTPCHSGVPPQIKSLKWCPAPQHAGYVSKEAQGMCDVFCTAGERHLKVWAFNREAISNPRLQSAGGQPLIFSKACVMGKVTADKAKCFLSASFVQPPAGASGQVKADSYDLLVCGNNGMVYKFRQAACVLAVSVSTGPVSCGYVSGGRFVVGAALGQIKVLDRHTLAELTSFSVHPSDGAGATGANSRPGTGFSDAGGRRPASAGGRPASAGGGRPSTASSVGGPSRTAGGNGNSKTPSLARKARVPPAKGADGKVATAWGGPSSGFVSDKCSQPLPPPDGVKASTNVIGLAVELGSYSSQDDIRSILAVTGFGKAYRVSVMDGTAEGVVSFHYGPVWALAAGVRSDSGGSSSLIASGGDDKWLTLFSMDQFKIVTRARCRYPLRCCHFNSTCTFIAVGLAGGGLSLFSIESPSSKGIGIFSRGAGAGDAAKLTLSEVIHRSDCVEDISDVKFSPNDKMLAVGSHDGYIDVYGCSFALATHLASSKTEIRYLKRLRGHVSYITHLDWSADNQLLQSTCGAYEILYWNVGAGKQLLSSTDNVESDTIWNSFTCPLGFPVMGIWPLNSDGTDVNSVDVIFDKGLVLTGDDFGQINLFNYPCVVKNAPPVTCSGHSSHVMNVRVIKNSPTETWVASVGGNDNSLMVWAIQRRKGPPTAHY